MNKKALFYLTRRSSFLWKSSLILIAAIIALGAIISLLNTNRFDACRRVMEVPQFEFSPLDDLDQPLLEAVSDTDFSPAIREILESRDLFHEKLELLSYLLGSGLMLDSQDIPLAEEVPGLSEPEYEVASAFISTFAWADHGGTLERIIQLAEAEKPIPNANYALALIHEAASEDVEAIKALGREINTGNSGPARRRLVLLHLEAEDVKVLEQLQEDPDYKAFFTPYVRHELALLKKDWPGIVNTIVPASYDGISGAMVLLALLSGAIWVTILLRFNGALSFRSFPVRIAVPALLLGALSAHATVLCIYWQEDQLNFTMGTEMISQLIYCVLGIGLREELLKLLFFIPLIPFLLKRSDLEILSAAALVGLGFAIEENINYFEASAGISAVGRFVTANFLHLSLTAICGLTLTRAIEQKGTGIQLALVTFGTAVVAHGLYDAFMMVPALMDYSFLSFTIFILIGYQYFGWLRHLRDEWREPVSITSLFTCGVILVTGISYCLFAWNVGPLQAFRIVAGEFLSIGIILIMFYREIPESIDQH